MNMILPPSDAKLLVLDKKLADFAEQSMSELHSWLSDLDEVELEDADPGKISRQIE